MAKQISSGKQKRDNNSAAQRSNGYYFFDASVQKCRSLPKMGIPAKT
jgi:hypothetical protein